MNARIPRPVAPPATWTTGYVEANGIRVHWTRTGGDLPPLVLAHGFTDDGGCWSPVARALAADWDVVMLDARGHGLSAAPAHGYDRLTMAADLVAACAALGVERPALLGHSMGAVTALVAAGRRPGWVRAVIAEDPPGFWYDEAPGGPARDAAAVRREIAARRRLPRQALLALGRAEGPTWSDEELAAWVGAKRRVRPSAAEIFDPVSRGHVDWGSIFAAIDVPILLIGGDPACGSLLAEPAARALLDAVPGARLVRIAGAGHSVRRDAPERYLDLVRSELAARR